VLKEQHPLIGAFDKEQIVCDTMAMVSFESTRHAGAGPTTGSSVVQKEINRPSRAVPSGDDDDGTRKLYQGSAKPMIAAPLLKIADLEVSLKPRGCWKLMLCCKPTVRVALLIADLRFKKQHDMMVAQRS